MENALDNNVPGKKNLQESGNKNQRIDLRTTGDQKKTLIDNAEKAGLSLTDFVLQKCLSDNIPPTFAIKEKGDIISELRRIGNNINQIARHLNQNKMDPLSLPILRNVEKAQQELLVLGEKLLKI